MTEPFQIQNINVYVNHLSLELNSCEEIAFEVLDESQKKLSEFIKRPLNYQQEPTQISEILIYNKDLQNVEMELK